MMLKAKLLVIRIGTIVSNSQKGVSKNRDNKMIDSWRVFWHILCYDHIVLGNPSGTVLVSIQAPMSAS